MTDQETTELLNLLHDYQKQYTTFTHDALVTKLMIHARELIRAAAQAPAFEKRIDRMCSAMNGYMRTDKCSMEEAWEELLAKLTQLEWEAKEMSRLLNDHLAKGQERTAHIAAMLTQLEQAVLRTNG